MKKQLFYVFILTFLLSRGFAETNTGIIKSVMDSVYQSPPNSWVVTDQSTDKNTGLTHAYVQQMHHGIPVYNAISILVLKNNKLVYYKSGFIEGLKAKIKSDAPSITPRQAIDFSLKHLGLSDDASITKKESPSTNKYIFEGGNTSRTPIRVELVYTPVKNEVILTWNVSIDVKKQSHWWNVRVDANSGNFVQKNDYVAECKFERTATDEDAGGTPVQTSTTLSSPPPSIGYNVFPLPVEAPTFGPRAILTNPADPASSPYGWHDVNGAAGAEFTITRGNNVYAYEDMDNDDLPGYSPDGGASLYFDFPYNINNQALLNEDASLTNLFYVNNAIHDRLNHLGFDGPAGNFQENNYGGGGAGNDAVLAEGFDGSGTDNANFGTPPDGQNPRMQMYLWAGQTCATFNVNSPAAISGAMTVGGAGGNPVPATVTGDLILVDDGSATPTLGCYPIVNNLTGKIAVIDRGICPFIYKVYYAQMAGAIGVIIINNVPGLTDVSGSDPSVTIPRVMVSQADGAIILNAMLTSTVNVTITTCPGINTDSDFDNGIIEHEYGHGVSNRLTGGPSNSGCLGNGEQGGEGWSDWLALMLSIKPGDNAATARPIGTYALAQSVTGPGIRTYPYSTDMSINPHTYADLALNPEVHYIGEIWCSAVWDLSWLLINQYGYNPDPTIAAAGNNLAIRLILEGMKLQPCGPGFLDARDAILQADHILYNDAHRCMIWQAFARRGMGYLANQGSADIAGDETEDFSMPTGVQPFPSGGGTFCLPGNTVLDAGAGWFSYSWSNGATTQTIVPSNFGSYTVTVTGIGCNLNVQSGSATLEVKQSFNPIASATPPTVCLNGSTQLDAQVVPSIGGDNLTNTPFSSPSPYGNWWTSDHEQYLILASEMTNNGYLPGNITSLAFDVVSNNSGPGSKNLNISIAHTLVNNLSASFISTGFTQVFSSPNYVSTVGWNVHTFSSPFNWDGVSNIVVDISMINCNTCPGSPCVEFYANDVVHLSNTSFNSSAIALNDGDCTIPSFTPDVPVFNLQQRPNIQFAGNMAPSAFSWTPGTFLNNTAIHNPLASNVTAATTYTVTVTKPSGCWATASLEVAITPPPAMPGPINGNMLVCRGTNGLTFCIDEVPGATTYQWTLPNGASGSSTTNCITINVNSHFSGGNLCVKAINPCGVVGAVRCTTLTLITSPPGKAGAITGPGSVCLPATSTYCINPVAKADSYIWTITGNGGSYPMSITGGQGTTCITVDQPAGYNGNQHVAVRAQNCKGLGVERKMDVKVKLIPSKPGTISGSSSVCKSNTKTYSVANVAGASSYSWSITGGAVIQSGQGTRTVSVKFTTATVSSAVLSVTADNSCGSSVARTKNITVNLGCKVGEGDDSPVTALEDASAITVYPNPTNDKITVNFNSEAKTKVVFKVLDLLGSAVMVDESTAVEGTNNKTLDLSHLAKGIYFLSVTNENGDARTLRVVVQ